MFGLGYIQIDRYIWIKLFVVYHTGDHVFCVGVLGNRLSSQCILCRFEMKAITFKASDGKFVYQVDLPVPL